MAVQIFEEAWSGNISQRPDSDSQTSLMPSEGKTPLPREYAKYKKRLYDFTVRM
jgi:hypothetical protein